MMVAMNEIDQYRLTKDQATWLNNSIKNTIKELEDLLEEFITGEGWLALGYETAWAWWQQEIGEKRLGGSVRDKVILKFKEEGAGSRTTAKAIGASRTTVQKVLDASQVAQTGPPITPTEIIPSVEEQEQIVKEYLAAQPEPVPFDISDDKGAMMEVEITFRHLENVSNRVRGNLTPQITAKLRIELQILRDMIDDIEGRL